MRKHGLSALIRVYNEEEWIGRTIESIQHLFDEILILYTEGTDNTHDILRHYPNIHIIDYPHQLHNHTKDPHSIHDTAYHTNYGIAHTTYSHISVWDADMLLLPRYNTPEFHDYILTKNIIRIHGINIATPDLHYASAIQPLTNKQDIRFYKHNPHIYYEHTPYHTYETLTYHGRLQLLDPLQWIKHPHTQTQKIYNELTNNDIHIPVPIFLHVKPIKMRYGTITHNKLSEHTKHTYYARLATKGKHIQNYLRREWEYCTPKKQKKNTTKNYMNNKKEA